MSDERRDRSERLPRRELLRRAAILAAAVPGAGAAFAAAPPSASLAAGAAPRRGGTLTVGLDSDATTLDPGYSTAEVDRQIYYGFFDGLVDVDAQLRIVPKLAVSWKPLNDTTWEVKLRPGVRFHDGTVFDAQGAKANFDRILDPKAGSPRRGEIPYVEAAEAVDAATLRLHLTGAFAPLPYSLSGFSGLMISRAAIDKYGKDLASNPIGTGPFSFVRWLKGDHIDGKAFADYWQKGRPYVDAIRYEGIPDPEVKANAVRSGTIDATENLLAKDTGALQHDSGLQMYARPGLSVASLRLQLAKPPFNNRALREAIGWAVDRGAINRIVYYGIGAPARSFLPPTALGYDPAFNPFPQRDLVKAKAKLAEGGQPHGFAVQVQILNNPEIIQLAQAIKQQLADVGIDAQLVTLDNGTLLGRLVAADFAASIITYFGTLDPFQGFSRFFLSTSKLNVYGYKSPEFDGLLAKAAATADAKARAALYSRMDRLVGTDLPWVFLRYPDYTEALRTRVQGYTYIPDGGMRFTDAWLTS
ncbi:MAG TPA: ABC transporter substrate-binding protein [bacterium]|nr:ABC transporter substrate-binding protein [bacterium]